MQLESIIEKGKRAFIEVGRALAEIQRDRLYREQGFSTFEEYCKTRWGFARQTAYDYVHAADVVENVRSSVQTAPSSTQARELSVLPPEQQREIASTTDFSETTVRELRERIAEVKPEVTNTPSPINDADDWWQRSESEEWYTPPKIIEATCNLMGGIDLDPCSNKQKSIPATHHFTKEDNGLAFEWYGRIYMNPTYGKTISLWTAKLSRNTWQATSSRQ